MFKQTEILFKVVLIIHISILIFLHIFLMSSYLNNLEKQKVNIFQVQFGCAVFNSMGN